jgi:hypothetical protein
MPTAGYSGTPLLKKLGLRPDLKIWLIHPPDDYFQWLGSDISAQVCKPKELPDWVHLFAADHRRRREKLQDNRLGFLV